jgi:hypothetical protein
VKKENSLIKGMFRNVYEVAHATLQTEPHAATGQQKCDRFMIDYKAGPLHEQMIESAGVNMGRDGVLAGMHY